MIHINSFFKSTTGCLLILIMLSACKKFLNEKQDNKFTTPQSLADLQMLLDNYTIMNSNYPCQQEIAADNYYLSTADFNALSDNAFRNFYTWQKDDTRILDWSQGYRPVLYANTVLQELPKFTTTPKDIQEGNRIKGAAYFYRANALFIIAQVYAPAYDSATAQPLPGIPVRTTADVNAPSFRATVKETYDQIINDFKNAALLLDTLQPYASRPTRQAAFAALARTYLITGNYAQALSYADSALKIKSSLINFNTLSPAAALPFARFNTEVIFPCITLAAPPLAQTRAKVDTLLYRSYQTNDLRRTLYFKPNSNGSIAFKGDYNAATSGSSFIGYTTDELYITKAECQARLGMLSAACSTADSLLRTRYKTGTYTPLSPGTAAQTLDTILAERRKELCFRGIRWSDLRRLNKSTATQTSISRNINNQAFTLQPGSLRYTFLIPLRVIQLSGIQQNL